MAPRRTHTRRSFLGRLGEAGAAAFVGGVAAPASVADAQGSTPWDVRWIERVQRAKYRAVFDSPSGGAVLDLATRYLNHLELVHRPAPGEVAVVLNLRTRAVPMGLSHAIWQKYPVGEDAKVTDPGTGAPAKRNIDWQRATGPLVEGEGLEQLERRGAIPLICDFALGHLATRLAKAAGTTAVEVHAELRAGLIPGAVLVPSGIYSLAQAQNAGCGYVPA
jgi:hypothetical protein